VTDIYDLHSHSLASDGALSPTELVKRAHEKGVTVLALTDHDTTNGLAEAQQTAAGLGMRLINGIELSASHLNQCLHIVGLNIDPDNLTLSEGIAQQQSIRDLRAKQIAEKLEKKKIFGAYEFVTQAAGNGEITRSHFADFLLTHQHVTTQQEAFDRYLSKGQPAFVPTIWASLEETVAWIKAAGGVAVLAHPMRYKLSVKWMNRALAVFKQAGGEGIEVVTGRASLEEIRISQQFAEKHQLYASAGSDFHAPDNLYLELGRLAAMPVGLKPVWELF
jgi:predicted metal-dependent phosphoesterase TrpH